MWYIDCVAGTVMAPFDGMNSRHELDAVIA